MQTGFRALGKRLARESAGRGRDKLYFATTRTSGNVIEGKLPLTAAEALACIKRNGPSVEIRDEQQRAVSVERLTREAKAVR